MKKKVDILLPCYNEESTIAECIKRINKIMKKENYNYNIIVCDNNSNDNSRKKAKQEKAKVVIEKEKGYGATILNGLNYSKADYIVMLDSDLSYNEKHIPLMLKELDEYDFIIGNRFKGIIEKKAMPITHRYGSQLLTIYANTLFRTPSHDYHCGLRAFKRKEMLNCNLSSPGFEFASEMVIKSKLNNLKIKEIPTDLFIDGRDKPSHLNTIKDGFRHLFLINKIKFQTSTIFRYTTTYIFMIALMFFLLVLTSLIPQKVIYKNTIKSLDYFEEYYNNSVINNSTVSIIEGSGDVRNISMAYNMDSTKPLESAIRMKYQTKLDNLKNLKKSFIKKEGKTENYSRYWQGQAMYSKIMLVFMPLKYTYIVQLIILIILFSTLVIKLFKISKELSISFIIMSIGINAFFTAFSVQYFFAIFLAYIFSILIINMTKKNSRYIGLLFAINGMVTCFFDFLTCETLVLTLPLFIYAFIRIIENKSINIKEILKYILLWGIFYVSTYMAKWFIDCLYFGFDYINVIMQKAFVRIDNKTMPIYMKIIKGILLSINDIIPFYYFKNGMIMLIILMIICLYLIVFEYKKYLPFLLISIIPIGRYIALSTHSYNFHYFTYRSFGVLVLLISIVLITTILQKLHKR